MTERRYFMQRRYIMQTGLSFGSALAMVISYSANKSILWAIVHGLLSWLYVIYAAISG